MNTWLNPNNTNLLTIIPHQQEGSLQVGILHANLTAQFLRGTMPSSSAKTDPGEYRKRTRSQSRWSRTWRIPK